jgi:ABC-2 type transport system ATP-binding protein
MLEVKKVVKRFGNLTAVDGVSFTAGPGEIFGLIGPNGAGKTTTIRMIMNIFGPDEGEILLNGRRLTQTDKERIGYLPEERGLYKKITVQDMLLYLADLKGADRARSRANIDAWLERLDLGEWKNHKIEELSKGMSQKVQFIATLVHDPEIIFFDEPFSGLDPVSSDILLGAIEELGKQGKIILFSTHLMENAERICGRIFLINRGREVVSGSMGEIKEKYGKRAVILECDGDTGFIDALPEVASIRRYPRWLEIELIDGGDPDSLLKSIAGKVSVKKFERANPSLHAIFVDLVKP